MIPLPNIDMTTITASEWVGIIRNEWECLNGMGCGRVYQLAKRAHAHGRADCVDLVAFKLLTEAKVGEASVKDGVYHHTGVAPAVALLMLIRVGVIADSVKWLRRSRHNFPADLKAHPRVLREAAYMDVTL